MWDAAERERFWHLRDKELHGVLSAEEGAELTRVQKGVEDHGD